MHDTYCELTARTEWALALVANLVDVGRRGGWLAGSPVGSSHELDAGVLASPEHRDSPMRTVAARLSLSDIELDALWLLACVELDPCVARASQLLLFPGMHEMSIQTVERLLGRGAALTIDVFAHLERLALVQLGAEAGFHRRAVRVHDRVVDLAKGQLALDRTLGEVASLDPSLTIRRQTQAFDIEISDDVRAALASSTPCLIVATGVEGSGRATLLRHALSSNGRAVLSVNCEQLSTNDVPFVHQLRAIAREARVHDASVLLLDVDSQPSRMHVIERELLAQLHTPVGATAKEVDSWPGTLPIVPVTAAMPDSIKREAMWRSLVPGMGPDVANECAQRYAVTPGMMSRAARAVGSSTTSVTVHHVHTALRALLERSLSRVARRIETRQTWDDLVLPVDQLDILIELVARVRHRRRVLDDWGFAAKVGRGLGISALLSGPPGTGKTMVAGLVAQELGLDLYQVDLSKIVSKYIGETEKQLAALFEAAESGHAILLFDEADSLFAKRTEVKSSNDRYANLEVNYLLQRIEAFSGISLLTTNHETAIDQAFMRRLSFHVRVPMPDERERELLWHTMLPEQAERSDDLDFAGLADAFVMSGGYIKNAVLRAAFLCAEEGTPISNAHLWRAGRAEYEAMGKVAYHSAAAERIAAL